MKINELIFIVANGGQVTRHANRDGSIGYSSEAKWRNCMNYTVPANIVNAAIRQGLVAIVGHELTLTSEGVAAYNPSDVPADIKNRLSSLS